MHIVYFFVKIIIRWLLCKGTSGINLNILFFAEIIQVCVCSCQRLCCFPADCFSERVCGWVDDGQHQPLAFLSKQSVFKGYNLLWFLSVRSRGQETAAALSAKRKLTFRPKTLNKCVIPFKKILHAQYLTRIISDLVAMAISKSQTDG